MKQPNTLQTILGTCACKLTRNALRLMGRGGTALPGKVAMKLAPNILTRASEGMEVIVVTGTNGKTTTARMLSEAYTAAGMDCITNKSYFAFGVLDKAAVLFSDSVSHHLFSHLCGIETDYLALHHTLPTASCCVNTYTSKL